MNSGWVAHGEILDRNRAATGRALWFRVAVWMAGRKEVTAQQLMATFDLSRATAYRVVQDWRDAQGVQ